jgi:hypothetical protein
LVLTVLELSVFDDDDDADDVDDEDDDAADEENDPLAVATAAASVMLVTMPTKMYNANKMVVGLEGGALTCLQHR